MHVIGANYHTFEYNDNRYEIDFVSFIKGKINVIEVKSTKRFTTSSLSNLKLKYPQLLALFNKNIPSFASFS